MNVNNAVTILTGASAGIGLATLRAFAGAGATLALVSRSADALELLAHELRAIGHEAAAFPADMRNREQVRTMVGAVVARFGRVDILINNAGQAAGGAIADVDPEHFQRIFELNVLGPLHAIQAVVPVMRRQGGGLIINVSSNVSRMFIPGIGAYAATKYALNGLSGTARVELAPDNIRVVTVFPRLTATDFGKNALRSSPAAPYGPTSRPGGPSRPTPDPPELVAQKILEAARNEPEEQFMSEDQRR